MISKKIKIEYFIIILIIILIIVLYPVSLFSDNVSKIDNDKQHKVALILTGGAARGYCHIGVLSVLEEYNIPIDFIIGISMGSVVGGYYSYGYSINQMLEIARNFSLMSLVEIDRPFTGFLSGEKLENIFIKHVDFINIENLKKKLLIIATDLNAQKMVVFDHGPLYIAMRASTAIPGVFDPVLYKGMLLVDGGIFTNYPIDLAKKMGADIIIVSNVAVATTMPRSKMLNMILKAGSNFVEKNKSKLKEYPLNNKLNLKSILTRTMLIIEENQHISKNINMSDVDFMIEPVSDQIKPFDFYKVDEGYKLGRSATLKIIDKILDKLNR